MDRKPLTQARKQESRFARLADRLARSSRVFMLGVIAACGIEVLVDWNATLFEINVLRDRMRERGFNYVGILAKSTETPLANRDPATIATLTAGLFDDEDVALVRFTQPDGSLVWEQVNPTFEQAFVAAHGQKLHEWYGKQLARDIEGLVRDPEALRRRMAESRYRDFAQRWSDAMGALSARFVGPPKLRAGGLAVYQDRLRTPDKQRDDELTYALAAVTKDGKTIGAIAVAFSMERTNAAIRTKYFKGLGMVVFFVGLILVQNVMSRRDKLRLLDLESRYASAKAAVHAAFGRPILHPPVHVAVAIDQATAAVDGMAWDAGERDGHLSLTVIDPDGDGIDAAAVALHALRTLRNTEGSPLERAKSVGAAILDIPLTRPLGILLVRVAPDGAIDGVGSPFADLRILADGVTQSIERTPMEDEAGLIGPLSLLSGHLPAGALLVGAFGHSTGRRGRPLDVDEVAAFVARAHGVEGRGLEVAVDDAVTWARGRATALSESDIAIVAMARSTPSPRSI